VLKYKNFNLFFIFLVFTLSLVSISAAPPTSTILAFESGYEIGISPTGFIKQNQDYQLNFFVYNKSNGVHMENSTGFSCLFYMANSTGNVIVYQNTTFYLDGHWGINILGGNFSSLEIYPFGIKCEYNSFGGATISYFEVTGTGRDGDIGMDTFLILIFAAIIVFVGSYVLDMDWGVFLSGILFILAGIYSMIYGLGNVSDLYTRGIAIICIGIGLVFLVASLFNISKGEGNEED
jgi:hypothetical protein